MRPFFCEAFGNPSSLHQHGLRARDALDQARRQVAALVNAGSPEEIIFTSGGTESANLAVKGAAYAGQRRGNHVVVSAIEHPSVLNSVAFLEKHGFSVSRVAVDRRGWVEPEAVREALTEKTCLIAVHHANHDIGTIEPISEIGRLAADKGIPFFVDAVASAGWIPVDAQAMGVSLLSLSPHRFYGPKGVGVLYRARRTRLEPILHGGIQEGGRRAGLENVPAIVGGGVAAEVARRELAARRDDAAALQARLWKGVRERIPQVCLNGPPPGPDRLPNHLNLSVEFIEGEGQLLLLDVNGIAVASGSSCLSKALKISHVLAAIGLEHSLALASILISLGKDNTAADIDYFLETFEKVVTKLRGMSPLWDEFKRGQIPSVIEPDGRDARIAKSPAASPAPHH